MKKYLSKWYVLVIIGVVLGATVLGAPVVALIHKLKSIAGVKSAADAAAQKAAGT